VEGDGVNECIRGDGRGKTGGGEWGRPCSPLPSFLFFTSFHEEKRSARREARRC
jgi:hypothetical protein